MQQRQGIDRIFTNKETSQRLKVEYKSDERASSTGNAFIETISVDTAGKQGWAYTSQSMLLMYFLPDDDLCYIVHFDDVRAQLERWIATYPTRQIPNKGYCTHGLLVPLMELEK